MPKKAALTAGQWLINHASDDNTADMEDAIEEEATAIDIIAAHLEHHHCVPTGLGAKRSSVHHRAHAVLHALWLQTGSPPTLARMLECCVSMTGDLGVESGLCDLPPARFSKLFPYLVAESCDDGGLVGDGEDEQEDAVLSFAPCMFIPGCLHILGNATRDMLLNTQHFEELQTSLSALLIFLNDKLTRNLFVARCLVGQFAHYRPLLRSFRWTLVGWRWDSVWGAVTRVLELEQLLRAAWSLQQMRCDGEDLKGEAVLHEEGAKGVRANIEKADAAVTSRFFWGYLHMIAAVGGILEHAQHWLEGCPCHGALHISVGRHYQSARTAFLERLRGFTSATQCPLVSRRAPEMACGELDVMIDEVAALKTTEILVSSTSDLTVADRGKVVADFHLLRGHVVQLLKIKFSCWQQLPRVLCGLAHACPDRARDAGRTALRASAGSAVALHMWCGALYANTFPGFQQWVV